jgi:SAM-dependent methyltransferase
VLVHSLPEIGLADVRAVYAGREGELWQLLMGQQIHIGGFQSSQDLAERAGIARGTHGVDLCCCNGAGMRFLVRFRDVRSMTGVDATEAVVERGRRLCAEEGLGERVRFVLGDACASGLPDASADFVWSEDAGCYVVDNATLLAEAVRIVRPGGTIAFTDWVSGPRSMSDSEAERFLRFMKFSNVETIPGYRRLLEAHGCDVLEAADTGRFVPYLDLYRNMAEMQLTWDALRILAFDLAALARVAEEMSFLQELARAGKVVQGRFVARRR